MWCSGLSIGGRTIQGKAELHAESLLSDNEPRYIG